MDIQDFEGNFKYKLYLPVLYGFNWLLMIFGPFYFPKQYQIYYLWAMGYLAFRSLMTAIWTAIGCFSTHQLLRQRKDQSLLEIPPKMKLKEPLMPKRKGRSKKKKSFLYAFIIPNYKEDQEVLYSTLSQLTKHTKAKEKYLILLAMEDHEVDSDKKAQILGENFKEKFRYINYTIHTLRKYQQRGKAANVSWCAEHLEEFVFNKEKIDPETVILTIIDADSWVPQQYIEKIDQHLQKDSGNIIFEPCQMFIRNHMEVPTITRTYDISHGMVQFSNLFSLWNTSFPLSNYSLSFKLAKSIGFWDTCPDAIGEDFHTTIKAFTKTRGNVKTVSIFTPFNQLNINTGRGTFSDISARFWQAQRHGRGCADAAYCLNQIFSKGISLRMFFLYYQVLQITTLPGILPWCMIGSTILRIFHPQLVNSQLTGLLFNLCTLSFVFSFFAYFYTCRRAAQIYYKQKYGQHWLPGVIQYLLLFIPNLFLVTVPSATIAAFRVAFGQNVYTVAQKKTSNLKIKETSKHDNSTSE